MSNPKISVIIPIYNVEKYLDRCMSSILNQTFTDLEIIMVDDGSPDGCPEMCDAYAKKDARIKVVHKKNSGLGMARNSGLDVATGDFVAFCDSDDYIDKRMYEVLYSEAIKNNCDAVYSGFNYISTDGRKTVLIENDKTVFWDTPSQVKDFYLSLIANGPNIKASRQYEMSVCKCIFKRSIIEENHVRFMSERECGSEDIVFDIDLLPHARKIEHVPYAFYNYCRNTTSLTQTFHIEKFNKTANLHEILAKRLNYAPDALLHIDRLFIETSRGYLMGAVKNLGRQSYQAIKSIVSNNLFKEVSKRYKYSYLPLYPRTFYWLEVHKYTTLLYLLCKLVNRVKAMNFYHPFYTSQSKN